MIESAPRRDDQYEHTSSSLISAYVEHDRHFVERPWFEEKVQEALADPHCRFLLLTGAPGSGKTAAMAWLAGQHADFLRYFVRRDGRYPLSSSDAQSFLLAIGHQLSASRPSLFQPDRLEIVVRQRAGPIASGGRLVAISVDDLLVSPFYRTALQVDQESGPVEGEVVAISARRAVLEDRVLVPENLQYLALLDPATLLLSEDPEARIVVLVDGLDETRYSTSGAALIDWLANSPELPSNIRVVLTSRPDEELLFFFRQRQHEWLREEDIDADASAVRRDTTRFAEGYAGEGKIAAALAANAVTMADFVARSVAKAHGNFQYLSALWRAIDDAVSRSDQAATARLLNLDGLPSDLENLYSLFIGLIAADVRGEVIELQPASLSGVPERMRAWDGLYRPVLDLLASAYAPFSAAQLARFMSAGDTAIDFSVPVAAALGRLRPFLRQDNGLSSLYHDTFREYLTTARSTHLRAGGVEAAHRRIAQYYRAGHKRWSDVAWRDVDDYGLTHLIQHLDHCRPRIRRSSENSTACSASP